MCGCHWKSRECTSDVSQLATHDIWPLRLTRRKIPRAKAEGIKRRRRNKVPLEPGGKPARGSSFCKPYLPYMYVVCLWPKSQTCTRTCCICVQFVYIYRHLSIKLFGYIWRQSCLLSALFSSQKSNKWQLLSKTVENLIGRYLKLLRGNFKRCGGVGGTEAII